MYQVKAQYGVITAYTTVEAGSEEEAIRRAEKALLRPIRRKYPETEGQRLTPGEKDTTPVIDATITVTPIPDTKPEDELANLVGQKQEIEKQISTLIAKMESIPVPNRKE